ncbi:hypothetical protein J7K27_09015 [Candidatus Bathyarchaeota archaeon]|nr:hypothetical protein [Candidatus Bathyarchaeota archaeon]
MHYQWETKKLNVEELSQEIEEFLKRRNFSVIKEKEKQQVNIYALPTKKSKIPYKVEIELEKRENTLTLTFLPSEKIDSTIKIGLASTFLFGGIMILRGIKYQEKMEKLEKELIQFIQQYISLKSS